MRWSIQELALGLYRLPLVNGLFRTRIGSRLYVVCYDIYKNIVEAPGNGALAAHIAPGTWVIDVGANIGFFTELFARWVKAGGRVIAIEPDADNLELLRRRMAKACLVGVDIHQAAAMESSGLVRLQRNPRQPSDHRIGEVGDLVTAVTVDEIVEQAGSPIIGLIKIDTQGSEHRVLTGASKTLRRCRPTLFIEIDDRALGANGTSAARLIGDLQQQGYRFLRISSQGKEERLSGAELIALLGGAKRGYMDVLCVPESDEARQADDARSGE